MALIVLAISIALLLVLITWGKLNALLALLVTAFFAGVLNGMRADAALKSILKGFGDTLGSLALMILFGAILGKLIEESGAAHTITGALIRAMGPKRIQWAVLIVAFLIGLPMFYNAAFLVLIPLIYTLATETGLPLVWLGMPMAAGLSIVHGMLPPHPGPAAIAVTFHADAGRTLLYGLPIAAIGAIVAGPLWAMFFRGLRTKPPANLHVERKFASGSLPGFLVSVTTILFPVALMIAGSIVALAVRRDNLLTASMRFLSDPNVALFLAVALGCYTLGLRRGRTVEALMKDANSAVSGVAVVLFIIAAGGALKQVLLDAGTGESVKHLTAGMSLSPIVLAWATAVLLRGATGSATVAAITAAGIVLPIVPSSGVRPELLVLAIGAGSTSLSHFSDSGFWMFKEYFNLSVRETLSTWTMLEILIALVGLGGVLLEHALLGPP
ncbi:MAG: gluconate:H+ symporter [Bryobacteraceae bacterium]|jgi:gluconate transporter